MSRRAMRERAHLGQDRLVLGDDLVRQLHGLRLRALAFLLLLVLHNRRRSEAARLLVSRKPGLQHVLHEMVRTKDIAGLGIFDHPVCEARDVAGRLKDRRGRYDGGVELEHVLLDDEVLPPLLDDVRLQRGARRAIVVQTSDTYVESNYPISTMLPRSMWHGRTSIDFKRGGVEEPRAEQRVEAGLIEGVRRFVEHRRHAGDEPTIGVQIRWSSGG